MLPNSLSIALHTSLSAPGLNVATVTLPRKEGRDLLALGERRALRRAMEACDRDDDEALDEELAAAAAAAVLRGAIAPLLHEDKEARVERMMLMLLLVLMLMCALGGGCFGVSKNFEDKKEKKKKWSIQCSTYNLPSSIERPSLSLSLSIHHARACTLPGFYVIDCHSEAPGMPERYSSRSEERYQHPEARQNRGERTDIESTSDRRCGRFFCLVDLFLFFSVVDLLFLHLDHRHLRPRLPDLLHHALLRLARRRAQLPAVGPSPDLPELRQDLRRRR